MWEGRERVCGELPLVEDVAQVVDGDELGIAGVVGCFVDGS
jgi:hypothetical protein